MSKSDVNVVLNRSGVRELLKSEEMMQICKGYADNALGRLGDGYEVTCHVGKNRVNAKSIMVMMTLGLDSGEEITLSANGEDEEAAMNSIEQYLSNQ